MKDMQELINQGRGSEESEKFVMKGKKEDLEHCLARPKNKVKGVCLIASLREGSEFQIWEVKKKCHKVCDEDKPSFCKKPEVSLTKLVELLPHLGKTSKDHPDKKKLISMQDFFRYPEAEGRRYFEELDKDGDGQIILEDLEVEMRKRKLLRKYATAFLSRARSGLKQFLSLME
ncbi:hypothetical protein LR48_Vigan2456s000100 [Vigna angularis]|uniref:EF-hand domain-containing protein n=1 Tax=Vigna angularis var. angularis TaxID=157739 RepID=A0A0S3S8C8_PHAAN|nr:hypothetical protein LR48_Vigan2456s000100 [Vigna angularis]BAT89095.1 hypothetical protein VIGAN_05277900 [Vigna angularis var. angularis]